MTAILTTAAAGDADLIEGRECAARLGLKYDTLMRWRKEGRVPGVKMGAKTVRFNLAQVAEALGVQVAAINP